MSTLRPSRFWVRRQTTAGKHASDEISLRGWARDAIAGPHAGARQASPRSLALFLILATRQFAFGGIDSDCNADKRGRYPSRAFSMP